MSNSDIELRQRELMERLNDIRRQIERLDTKEYPAAADLVHTSGTESVGGLKTFITNVIIAATATTGNALRVIRNLTATSTDAPVVDIVQDHTGDDQIALRVQQDGTGDLLSLFDGATEKFKVADGGNVTASGVQHIYGSGSGDATLEVHGGAGSERDIVLASGSLPRFIWRLTNTAESGSNAGSNLVLNSRADAGGVLQTVISIVRATGIVSFVSNVIVGDKLGVGPTAPAGKAHIDQDSTTAALPVLVLDQADVSEPMIEFETTVGTGNTIEAKGAKVLTTTHFLKVKLPDNSIAYIEMGTIA